MRLRVVLLSALALVVLVVGVLIATQPTPLRAPTPSPTASSTGSTGAASPGPVAPAPEAGAPDSPNASDYLVPDFDRPGVFFVSSSLNLRCGILIDEQASGQGLGRWGCFANSRTWEFASEQPGDPCFEPPQPHCGDGIEAVGHFPPAPMLRPRLDDTYASRWVVEDGEDGYAVRTLAAGESLTFAGITCSAAQNNVITCTDTVTGHGFTISGFDNEIY